jgi:hypothetical protein
MFKNLLLALAPLALLVTSAVASDDVLDDVAGLNVASISDAQISIDDGTAGIDIDGLSEKVGEKSEQAVEACFRRFGYGGGYGGGYCGYNSYNYGCYGSYNYCYSPCYSYNYVAYQPCVTYRPVYYTTYCQPAFSYWGCY